MSSADEAAPVFVFLGPSLAAHEAQAILSGATCLPPVAQGDVYRALQFGPRAIGIVDGFFDRVPAVWHKEILYALAQGVAVYGAASMGALRAAELDRYGMVGVGAVYEAYRDGLIEDDDEVAIAMAGAEGSYYELSDAMVNIRATTQAALQAGVIDAASRDSLDRAAKQLFYPERHWGAIIEASAAQGVSAAALRRFRGWLDGGAVNAKRDDAVRMLQVMRDALARNSRGSATSTTGASFRFAHTVFFDDLATSARWEASQGRLLDDACRGVLDELRLQPGAWRQVLQMAALRDVADDDALAQGLEVSDAALLDTTLRFRRERGLLDPAVLGRWLHANALDTDSFVELLEHETRLGWWLRSREDAALDRLPDVLRAEGRFAALAQSASAKATALDALGIAEPTLRDAGLSERALWDWYFGRRLRQPEPADIHAFAQGSGFADVEALRRAVLLEYLVAPGPRSGDR